MRFKIDLLDYGGSGKAKSVKVDNSDNFPLPDRICAASLQYIKQLSYVGMGW